MHRVTLPGTDLEVSTLCLGAAGFGTDLDASRTQELVDAFVQAGGNFFDTAHCYAFYTPGGNGASERALGRAVRGSQFVIATKGGHPDGGPDYPRPKRWMSPETVSGDIQQSLERLAVNCIDLYYLHRDDGVTPVDEVIDGLNAEADAGHIRYLGASNWSTKRVAEANAYAKRSAKRGFVAVQDQWSLAVPTWRPTEDPTVRFVTKPDVAWAAQNAIAMVPYSATANGFFSGAGSGGPFDTADNHERKRRAEDLASRLGATPTQVALAWLAAQPCVTVPIFSTTRIAHLLDAVGATDLSLTAEQVAWLGEVADF